jgi:hypothetical protein
MEITSRLAPSSVHEGTIDARIANYSTLPKKIGVDIVSHFVELGMYKWAVKVSPIGQIAAHDGHVGCYLVSGNDSDLTGSATICLIDGGGTKRFVQSFQDTEMLKGNAGWGFRKMVSVAELMLESTNLLVDDALRIRVEIHKVTGGLHTAVHFLDDSHYVYGGYSASSFIQSNCESRDAVFPCDVYIRTNSGPAKAEETEVIAAHKYMLAVHSPVFRVMFKNGMQEASSNSVTINDFSAPVVRAFVNFLYEDRCSRVSYGSTRCSCGEWRTNTRWPSLLSCVSTTWPLH